MTFNANIPNAGQSPGLFPNQGNINFTRLKSLINAEHIFNDSSQPNDGTHRQVTLTNRLDPISLPSTTNGMIFSKNDVTSGVTQLYFYNGTTIQQISGYQYILPMRIVGSASINSGASATVLSAAYNFSGTGHTWVGTGSTFRWRYQQFLRSGVDTDISTVDREGGSADPELIFLPSSPTVLSVQNNAGNTQTVFWSCIINRNS